MCTIGAIRINGSFYLLKTRDLEKDKRTWVAQEDNILIVTDEKGPSRA